MIKLTVLGSTGVIGVNTLDVVARHSNRCQVTALGANTNDALLAEQCGKWRPAYAVLADPEAADRLRARLVAQGLTGVKVLSGEAGLSRIAALDEVDVVMAAIVGAAGLVPTFAAVCAGKRVLLANKEALVMSGSLLMDAVRQHGAELLPIDSEHNAIFQCLPTPEGPHEWNRSGIRQIVLTASGGPFRERMRESLHHVSPEEACQHPTWVMGRKISVDSATMMNKGLEIIEACWLFNAAPDKVEVVIHPQSIVHSMVKYRDGSVLAQMGNPDMRVPIAHALFWPERVSSGVADLDITAVGKLEFAPADQERFPCLRLGYEAAHAGGTGPTIVNAANEIAVQAFLAGGIPFTAIDRVIESTRDAISPRPMQNLEVVLEDDAKARRVALALCGSVGWDGNGSTARERPPVGD